MDYFELNSLNYDMNKLVDQRIDKNQTPEFYAKQLTDLFQKMRLKYNDYPIIDPYNNYKSIYFYEGITTNTDLQCVVKIKFESVIKKYGKIFKLSLNPACTNIPIKKL